MRYGFNFILLHMDVVVPALFFEKIFLYPMVLTPLSRTSHFCHSTSLSLSILILTQRRPVSAACSGKGGMEGFSLGSLLTSSATLYYSLVFSSGEGGEVWKKMAHTLLSDILMTGQGGPFSPKLSKVIEIIIWPSHLSGLSLKMTLLKRLL